jgi:stage V sporulation protein S
MEIIQVSATSPASVVARAISSVIHEYHCAEVEAIGAGAIDQAMQAIILATGQLEQEGICIACTPKGKNVIADNKDPALVKLMVRVTSTPSPSSVSSLSTSIKAKDLPRA